MLMVIMAVVSVADVNNKMVNKGNSGSNIVRVAALTILVAVATIAAKVVVVMCCHISRRS